MSVAVIIPVWNRASTLRRAVESAQSQVPDEIVVVDDCSTDGSAELAESLGVRVIQHPQKSENWIEALGGVYRSLTSDYVIGMGADDVIYDGFVRNVREIVDSRRSHEWPGVVFGDYALLAEGNPLKPITVRHFGFSSITYYMTPAGARERFRKSPMTRHECGVGSAIRRDLLLWLQDEEYWRLGPWSDSFGYVLAAIRGGCAYVPDVHGGFCVQQEKPTYHQEIIQSEENREQYLKVAQEWLKRPGIAPYATEVLFGI